jgi:RHS repeat-associated protein
LTEPYTQTYTYDPAGNMSKINYTAHRSNTSGNWNREFGFGSLPPERWENASNNHLTSLSQDGVTHSYKYDANGNMFKQDIQRHHTWDHADRMIGFSNQLDDCSNHATVEARYLYDADGMRVKKWVRTNGTGEGESTVYVDGVFEHHRWKQPAGPTRQNNYLHIMDDTQRIALMRRGPAHDKDAGPPVQYHLGDHLGSSNVVIGGDNASANEFINREEYFPYGETAFGSYAKKRYRFTGKERDEESGLYYHGVRYYAPWLARWITCDPAERLAGRNLYEFVYGNPLRLVDPNGSQPFPPWFNKAMRVANLLSEVILGEFHEGETTWTGVGINIGVGALPGVGQIADIRDTLGAGAKVIQEPGSRSAWAGLIMAGVGWWPVMRDAIKGFYKVTKQTVKEGLQKTTSSLGSGVVKGLDASPPPLPLKGGGGGPSGSGGSGSGPLSGGGSGSGGGGGSSSGSGLPKIPHSSGRPLTVEDFKAGGKANEEMLNEGLNQIGVPTMREKYVRDASGNVLDPKRRYDIVAEDAAGIGHPLELTTPDQMSSTRKKNQMERDALHKVKSPGRTVKDDNGNLGPVDSPQHFGGYTIKADKSGLKN